MADVPLLTRELTAFERAVLELVCEGKTNSAIARETGHTEKVVENTVSRSATAFGLRSNADINVRVMLALAYRSHFGDRAWERFGLECQFAEVAPDGTRTCNRHV